MASEVDRTKTHPVGQALKGYALTVLVTAIATAICFALEDHLSLLNLVMVYLLGVSFIASRFGPGEAVTASVLGMGIFDILFVSPRGTLAVHDSQYLVTFVVMVFVALTISSLAQRLRRNAGAAAERERHAAALYSLSREMAHSRSPLEIARAGADQVREVFDADAAVMLVREGTLAAAIPSSGGFEANAAGEEAAARCLTGDEPTGRGTSSLPTAEGLFLPIRGSQGVLGVLGVLGRTRHSLTTPSERNLLETFANSMGLAIERAAFAKESQEARIQAEGEQMRNALLSSISHDLRTPLTAIAGAASSLREGRGDAAQLGDTIYHETVRLNLQVQNLLDMTRLRSGAVQPHLEWHSLEEIVGAAVERASDLLEGRDVRVSLPPQMPLLYADGELMGKVVVNLLENVGTHTPSGTPVEISAMDGTEFIRLDVADRGPGIPSGQEAKIFERFFRREERQEGKSFGLGLAICRAVMRLHEGRIWAENRRDGAGAVFHVEIPKAAKQPEVPLG
jgi:two-component system sensor histidine kinase KdpD